jgi:hypothetical protein
MRIATGALVVAGLTLSGCNSSGGSDDEPTTPSSSSPTDSASPTPSEPAVPETADDLVGDWADPDAQWTVHFKDDGTYVEDFQGVTDFRVGTYEISDGTVSLIGDDGNTDKGAVEGDTLVFKLGTLARQ